MCILDILSPLVQRTTHQRNKSFQNINRGQYIIEIINICCTGYNLMTKICLLTKRVSRSVPIGNIR